MTPENDQKVTGIQVIARAADILRALGKETQGLSLGQIARKVGLPRSTVQRIVGALASEGFISTEDGSGGIRLGPEIQMLAQASVRDTKDLLRPTMQRIADETGETVDLAVMEGTRMLFVDQIVGRHRLRTVSSIGERFPLTTTANGKAALACLDEGDAARLALAESESEPGAMGRLPLLLQEIQTIRDGALARDEDNHTEGVSALGFAMQDPVGRIYAISVPVPSSRYERLKTQLADVLDLHRRDIHDRLQAPARPRA
ncbi:IclR family transcriptional regulator [uncultured Tateyamaria sp.]|uniref:IclR family transcriptional regulator n=1 Tax=Tateyamaria sp. 1078 TaxID=3417464 RepID=UPI00261FFA41|nr:IclR family transcriptional regulator [uncultured Tateyamaria sp.]